jgi:signal transduction histidine kinase
VETWAEERSEKVETWAEERNEKVETRAEERSELERLRRRHRALQVALLATIAVDLTWETLHADAGELYLRLFLSVALAVGVGLAFANERQMRRLLGASVRAAERAQSNAALLAESQTRLQASLEALRESERRRVEELERAVAERTQELTLVNRELEAFSYSVSHDLRAPVRAVDGFAQALEEREAGQGAEARELLARIRGAARRMNLLIDDLLRLSRASRGELRRQEVDLSALAREVAAELAERDPARAVAWEVEPGVRAEGDPRLLRIALEQLLENAFKFTRGAPAAAIGFGASAGERGRAFFVRDNGAGFDPARADRLFQPFQRLHHADEFEGTGIGLATLRRIVHRHGGTAWAEGRPGKGACFWFTLGERGSAAPGSPT